MIFNKSFLIGQEIVNRGLISQDQLDEALIHQQRNNMRLGAALIALGYIKEIDLVKVLADQLNIEYRMLENIEIDHAVLTRIPRTLAEKHTMLAIELKGDTLIICVADPLDKDLLNLIESKITDNFELIISTPAEIKKKIETAY